MDWFSWLSKTSLEPSLVYEYGLAFSNNELEEEDIVFFNHEFLQSMGISIAKHRLEILKLSMKYKGSKRPLQVTRLIVAIKKTKRCLANYIKRTIVRCEDSTALVVVPSSLSSSSSRPRWNKSFVMKRNKKLMVDNKQERLLLTNGSSPSLDVFSSPMMYHFKKEEKIHDGYWSSSVEEFRWDTMFQDLKPN
ncbi:hypothetical protein TanjilG_01147 [Lupinus angustifolius]|uniref:SAM domain-containing protein n=1 Tax=Lupinus angustifolius TaxID=3871 RepID=A0A1J7GWK2_LUPAN|nr:PREDICTED: uncharacterized protein LOC109357013 [Lupinus angustifolius]OIW04951.1 hypothetical protein TanjilG_01147 [Lupinus angustifolius]